MAQIIDPIPSEAASDTPSNLTPSAFYEREADRLRAMANASTFSDVRDGLLETAARYDRMAAQLSGLSRHRLGRRVTEGSRVHAPGDAH